MTAVVYQKGVTADEVPEGSGPGDERMVLRLDDIHHGMHHLWFYSQLSKNMIVNK